MLGSNESGYSGDIPNQRGKFILIPKKALSLFPPLSERRLNDQSPVICYTLSGARIAVNFVYHNAKFFQHLGLNRDHNEFRLYRNVSLDGELRLDRYVVIGFVQTDTMGEYKLFSIAPGEENYEHWKSIAKSKSLHKIENLPPIRPLTDIMALQQNSSNIIVNSEEIFSSIATIAAKQRRQQPGLEDDPASVLATLIKSQKDYSDYLRQAYGGKCALRDAPLIRGSFLGLDATHIQPHTHKGPLLPTNGLLLSKDLHHAFEKGAFCLDDNNKVVIHPKVPTNSGLKNFAGKIVCPIPEYEIFKPFSGYVRYHKSNFYDQY